MLKSASKEVEREIAPNTKILAIYSKLKGKKEGKEGERERERRREE